MSVHCSLVLHSLVVGDPPNPPKIFFASAVLWTFYAVLLVYLLVLG